MKKILLLVLVVICSYSNSFSLMKIETEYILNPYSQGWEEEKVVLEDSLNLFHVSNIRVNQTGYTTDSKNKKAFVYNQNVGDTFRVINLYGETKYTGTLTSATDIDGNSIDSVIQGDLTSNFYFDASLTPSRIVDGYPKSNNRTGTEAVAVAQFNEIIENGMFALICGTDTSSFFEINPHIYGKLVSLQSMFLGFQRCGAESWSHSDCHMMDGSVLGSEYEGDLTGGWHDCGGHLKVGQTIGYTSMMISLTSVIGKSKLLDMFNGNYTDTLRTDGIPDLLREAEYGNRYIMKLYRVSKELGLLDNDTMITGVGDGMADYSYWDLPSLQDYQDESMGGADRKIHTNISSDILGDFAASLALFSTEWKTYNSAFADSCLAAAEEIYELGKKTNQSKWNFDGLYFGDGYFCDEMGMAAIALAYAQKEAEDFDKAKIYIDDLMYNTALGEHPASNIEFTNTYFPAGWLAADSRGGTFLSGQECVDWQNVPEIALYALLKLMVNDEVTAASYKHDRLTEVGETYNYAFFRERACNVFAAVIDDGTDLVGHTIQAFGHDAIKSAISYPPYNLPDPSADWYWNRSMIGQSAIPYLFGEYITNAKATNSDALKAYLNYEKYYSWGLDVSNYLLGMNPWDISMIIGGGRKFPHHIHNRTSTAELSNSGGVPYNFIPPYGAIAPWVAPSTKMIEDMSSDGIAGQGYKYTETCTDFSMPLMLMMVTASSDAPTAVETKIREKNSNKLSIYPNPVKDFVTIESSIDGEVFIIDAKKTVMKKVESSEINIASFPKGIYYGVVKKDGVYKSIKSFYKE